MTIITRFAPSPTGFLHLGHAYAAIFAAERANGSNNRFLLRIEDIDQNRCDPLFERSIFDDLSWLGLKWEEPVRRQSDHFSHYKKALKELKSAELIYPCFCTRKEILREIAGAGHAPHGADQAIYPGTCRGLGISQCEDRIAARMPYALRINMAKAVKMAGSLVWHDRRKGQQVTNPEIFGDVILARKEFSASYHLAATVDDHLQGISLVTRGDDLFHATHIHRLLQALLKFNTPYYEHHHLLVDSTGKRFAKRHKAFTLAEFRNCGVSPTIIFKMIGLTPT